MKKRLAYLTIAIAFAISGLLFISGSNLSITGAFIGAPASNLSTISFIAGFFLIFVSLISFTAASLTKEEESLEQKIKKDDSQKTEEELVKERISYLAMDKTLKPDQLKELFAYIPLSKEYQEIEKTQKGYKAGDEEFTLESKGEYQLFGYKIPEKIIVKYASGKEEKTLDIKKDIIEAYKPMIDKLIEKFGKTNDHKEANKVYVVKE